MITKRINTDLFLNLLFKDKLTGLALNYTGANDIVLEIKKQNTSIWYNQIYTLTEDGVIHFQWNANENNRVGIYDARISYNKDSYTSETGKIQYKYDAISLFQIVPTSDTENTETDTTSTIEVSVSWGGFDGMSAYELAVKHELYAGTEAEFAAIEPDNAANELIRISNESSRDSSEQIRLSSEIERDSAEGIRLSSETTRNQNEVTRENKESIRESNETDRGSAETIRISNENIRLQNELDRQDSEQGRSDAEIVRESNESDRKDSETLRAGAEVDRDTEEQNRVLAESNREIAEGNRVTEFNGIKQEFNTMTVTSVFYKVN